jgi:transposase
VEEAAMAEATLFHAERGASASEPAPGERRATSAPRILTAERRQVELRACDLESLLPADHRARAIWAVVERLDLGAFYAPIRARGGEPGRPATDPKVLIALWLYATSEGIGSAREVARLCEEHDAYRWLRGGVPINHHTLSDFRTGYEQALDELLTQVLASLTKAGLLQLQRVAQDGLRVRASAGQSSFRREKRLAQCLELARQHVAAVKEVGERGEAERSSRARAAQERAARERAARVEHALAELEKVKTMRARQRGGKRSKGEPRASTTDGEARTMRMGDGGYRPAYNVQLATETASRVIVGVQVTNAGTDGGQATPMLDEIERRMGKRPAEYLVDGGFATEASVHEVSRQGITLYAPTPHSTQIADPHAPRPHDTPEVAAWRQRMAGAAAKQIYRDRAATAETVNADLRTWRSLDRFLVRGLRKTLSVALWNVLAYNILRWTTLAGARA